MNKPWVIGNTTVRNPDRLHEGLRVIIEAGLEGLIGGAEGSDAFGRALTDHGVVTLRGDRSLSVGPKWRNALHKTGALWVAVADDEPGSERLSALADRVTRNGRRLLSEDPDERRSFFLRAIPVIQIPSVLDRDRAYDFPPFRPARHTALVLVALAKRTGDGYLNKVEMAFAVQVSNGLDDPEDVADHVLDIRHLIETSDDREGTFSRLFEEIEPFIGVKRSTCLDYADTNFRHLASSGLFVLEDGKLRLAEDDQMGRLVAALLRDEGIEETAAGYVERLAAGWPLADDGGANLLEPTDDDEDATAVSYWQQPDRVRERDAVLWRERPDAERSYAAHQAAVWRETHSVLCMLARREYVGKMPDGSTFEIPRPKNGMAAYAEWAGWRSILSLGGLACEPWDTRRFPVDRDFTPVNTAPGGGPDCIFRFPGFTLVLETTLLDSSRQEAAEGASVRAHVAEAARHHGKDAAVYCLFLARRLDLNTVETFRSGVWYLDGDLTITNTIPLEIALWAELLAAMHETGNATPDILKCVLETCLQSRFQGDAKDWKNAIERTVRRVIHEMRENATTSARRDAHAVVPRRPMSFIVRSQCIAKAAAERSRRKVLHSRPRSAPGQLLLNL